MLGREAEPRSVLVASIVAHEPGVGKLDACAAPIVYDVRYVLAER